MSELHICKNKFQRRERGQECSGQAVLSGKDCMENGGGQSSDVMRFDVAVPPGRAWPLPTRGRASHQVEGNDKPPIAHLRLRAEMMLLPSRP